MFVQAKVKKTSGRHTIRSPIMAPVLCAYLDGGAWPPEVSESVPVKVMPHRIVPAGAHRATQGRKLPWNGMIMSWAKAGWSSDSSV